MEQAENSFKNRVVRKIKSVLRLSPKSDKTDIDASNTTNSDKSNRDPVNETVELTNVENDESKKDR